MIVNSYSGFAFGTPSQYQDKECAPGGRWEDWCDCVFPSGPQRDACRTPSPGLPACFSVLNGNCYAPWTDAGAATRGLPKGDSLLGSAFKLAANVIPGIVATQVGGGGSVFGPGNPDYDKAQAEARRLDEEAERRRQAEARRLDEEAERRRQAAARRLDEEAERRRQGGGYITTTEKKIPTWAIGLGIAGVVGAGLVFMSKRRR